ncbi:MAG: hypothetical protein M1827_004255 [Pycnora praestabilis]|nr:MAG: hypothetical protein M1827_004255 [Pycnora praestabilis]
MPLIDESHDSLPYIDQDLTPENRSRVNGLLASETAPESSTSLHPSILTSYTPFFSSLIEREHSRLQNKQPLTGGIDTSRYEALEPPPNTSPNSDEDRPQLLAAWQDTLRKAYTSSSYLSKRLTNLALLESYGKNAWLVSNSQLEDILRSLERELADVQAQTEAVNKGRKAAQEGVRGEMEGLEASWRRGVGRVLEVEVGAEGLRREILERRKGGAR